jgi:hypothetical protein
MLNKFSIIKIYVLSLIIISAANAQKDTLKPASQNPSPMVENTRTHQRIEKKEYKGLQFIIPGIFKKQVNVFIPERDLTNSGFDLLIHFFSPEYIVEYAAEKYNGSIITACINLGAGSSVYYNAFPDSARFTSLISSIIKTASSKLGRNIKIKRIIISGFSAGYGAVKKLLSYNSVYNKISGVLLLDGMHASYVPERKVLYQGGHIDTSAYTGFLKFAKDACRKNSTKKFLFTHSEIFPGTFVSTTESADFLCSLLNLKIKPVLKWGPLGMQQLSIVHKNHFEILGFAGNTAPDHIDHLESLYFFLNMLMKM